MNLFDSLINKRVPLQFMGERLFFDLSQALFSSFKIDDGSRLLLKTIAQRIKMEGRETAADVGCGVGTLGVALKKRFPKLTMSICDRDALAVAMSLRNAELNQITIDRSFPALMDSTGLEGIDLLLCNVPAKAGEAVHRAFLASLPEILSKKGIAALVIVSPLEESFRAAILRTGLAIIYEEQTANHLVLHLSAAQAESGGEKSPGHPLGAAYRQNIRPSLEKRSYAMETVYGLPEFDTPSYAVQAAAGLQFSLPQGGQVLSLNPGQGHLPAWLAAGLKPERIDLAGRDLLQLITADHNLQLNRSGIDSESFIIPWPGAGEMGDRSYDLICAELDPVPKVSPALGFDTLFRRLKPGGRLLVYGRSSAVHLFLKDLPKKRSIESRKFRGFRALVLA